MNVSSTVRQGSAMLMAARTMRRWRRGELKEGELAALLLAPSLVFLCGFSVYPFLRTIYISLRRYKLTEPWTGFPFTGLDNYVRIASDPAVLHALKTTLIYVAGTVLAQLVFGLVTALLLHPVFRGRAVARTILLLPWTLSPVLAGVMWKWIFDASHGVLNDLLSRAGLVDPSNPVLWLGNPRLALGSVMTAAVWGASSYVALLLLAGLQSIPGELYEAARIDGASGIRSFFAITLPLLRPAMVVALTLRTIGALQAFDLPFAMTAGGPGTATETLPMYIYRYTFQYLDFGYGSALAVVLLVIGMTLAVLYVRALSLEV